LTPTSELRVSKKEGVPWGRSKVTFFISKAHANTLRVVSEAVQVPQGRLVDQALNDYFKAIRAQSTPPVPPLEREYIAQRVEEKIAGPS